MPAESKSWSVEEVRDMQDESRPWPRFELIGGKLLVTPAPGEIHQVGVAELLMIEVISPSSVRTDRQTKREYYPSAGVPEYWVIDFDARLLERWTPGSETPAVLRGAFEWRPAGASAALVVDLPALFENAWRKYHLFAGE